jgi:hypothetical protein
MLVNEISAWRWRHGPGRWMFLVILRSIGGLWMIVHLDIP